MGDVYRALDTRLERDVALKLISESFLVSELGTGSPSPAGTPHSRVHLSHERFLREARAAATLNHPNICAIHDVGEQDGQPYLVMELLRGETLKLYLISGWANTLPQLGQIQLARTTFLRAADQAASTKAQDAQAGNLLAAASAGWMVDRCFDPEPTVKGALQLDKGKLTLIAAATALALCNEEKQATPMLSALEKRYPEDTLVQELYVPQFRAWLAIKAGYAQRALDLLERVRAHDAVSYAPYMRGLAYLQLKDPRNAIASFQDATRLKGLA